MDYPEIYRPWGGDLFKIGRLLIIYSLFGLATGSAIVLAGMGKKGKLIIRFDIK